MTQSIYLNQLFVKWILTREQNYTVSREVVKEFGLGRAETATTWLRTAVRVGLLERCTRPPPGAKDPPTSRNGCMFYYVRKYRAYSTDPTY